MPRTKNVVIIVLVAILTLCVLAGLVWVNTLYVQNHPGEKDFLVPWLAARTFLQYGNNPYEDPATQRAQITYYGRLAAPGEDPLRLSIPFPIELFYLPFAMITDYALARGIWMTLLEMALIGFGILSMQVTNWKPVRSITVLALILSVFWVYGFMALELSSAVIFTGIAMAGFMLAMREQQDELAGALLVIPFFKPNIFILFIVFIFWWVIYHRRWRIIAGFLMTTVILLGLAFFLLSNWFMPFLGGVISHINYNPGLTPGLIFGSWWPFVGPRLGWLLTAVLAIVIFIEWRAVRNQEYKHFLWTACLTLAVTPLIGIPVTPSDEMVMLLPMILFIAILDERWLRSRKGSMAWLVIIILLAGFWLVVFGLAKAGNSVHTNETLMLSLPVILMIGLYWMRWWAVRPPRTWSDTLQ